ncbi:hypothetical protein PS6_004293, partial [Mucor atramentarius]
CAIQAENNNHERVDDSRFASSSTMVAENVTMEDTEEIPNLEVMPSDSSLEDNGVIYQCNICSNIITGYDCFQIHLRVAHNKDQKYKHPQLAPNLDKYNTYCQTCELECISVMFYQQHIQSSHHLSPRYDHIKGLGTRSDPIDLNYYCGVCKLYFRASGEYEDHLKCKHHLNQLSAIGQRNDYSPYNGTPVTQELFHAQDVYTDTLATRILPFNFCYYCHKQFRSNRKYVRHLKHNHKKILIQHKSLPKLSDLGYACLKCQIKFGSQTLLQDHLKKLHVVKDGVVKIEEEDKVLNSEDHDQPEVQDVIDVTPTDTHVDVMPKPDSPARSSPDINAYDYCHSCQTKFLSNWNYRVHLRLVHRMYVKEETKEEVHDISDGAILPDLCNSDWQELSKALQKGS